MFHVTVGLDQELAMPKVCKHCCINININHCLTTPISVDLYKDFFFFSLQDSYMLVYFQYLYKYFEVGVPVYFVTKKGYNFTSVDGMNGVCSSVGCDQFSLTQKVQYATEYPDR